MKKILVLGGTRFFGKRLVQLLLDNGNNVTIATRGKTPDVFGNQVNRLIVNREDYSSLLSAVQSDEWDIVYDNICYSPQDAMNACEVFTGKVKRYIFISSLSVYDAGKERLKGEAFDPYNCPIKLGGRSDFSYKEGKQLAEAIFFQKATFPVAAVRFPIVLGEDDYTKRLHFHVEHIKNRQVIGIPNEGAKLSFIQSAEAAEFLDWLGNKALVGPINACSEGELSPREILSIIEEIVGEKAVVESKTAEKDMSPFGAEDSLYMDISKAEKSGFVFQSIMDWFPKLVGEISQ